VSKFWTRKFYPLQGVECMWRAVTILLLPRFCIFYLNLHNAECIIALAWLLHHPAPLRCTRWRWEDLDRTAHHQTQTHNAACRQHTFTGTWVVLLGLHESCMSLCIVLYSLGQTLPCWVWWCYIEQYRDNNYILWIWKSILQLQYTLCNYLELNVLTSRNTDCPCCACVVVPYLFLIEP